MTDIVIKQEDTPAQPKPVEEQDIKETLRKADEYAKLKAENNKLEAEMLRQQELKAKLAVGGRGVNIPLDKTPEQKAQEEAKALLEPYGA